MHIFISKACNNFKAVSTVFLLTQIKIKQCVAVVSGHMLVEGVLLFGKADLYVCEGFTLTSSGDVCCGNHHPSRYSSSPTPTLTPTPTQLY